jgi:hypothetical protein
LPAAAGNAVTVHGLVVRGDLRVDGEEVVLAKRNREERMPRADFLLVEADDGKLLHAPGLEARLRGYEYLARAERAEACVKLIDPAFASRDMALARHVLDLAEADGFTGKPAEDWKRRIDRLERQGVTPDPKKADAVRARLAELAPLHPALLVARARVDEANGLRVLREALRIDPKHAGACALLAERAPKAFALGPPEFWLAWHLDLESKGVKAMPDDTRDLAQTRAAWRKDLYGIETDRIRLMTPVRDTRTVARCLAYGQLTCQALAELFKTEAPKPRITQKVLVHLYSSKEEYVSRNAGDSPEERQWLDATAGFYSAFEGLSRLVWDTDPDAERRIARVFVHELTHHWVTELNPRYANSELRIGSSLPGFWIVEGLATFIEEGTFDVQTGTWSFFDARAPSLDAVHALAKDRRLIPWELLYGFDRARAQSLPSGGEKALPVVRRWWLGRQMLSPARIFYEQAAATVHFLYHGEGGAYRARLLDYVTDHYTGKKDKMLIGDSFGMTPGELGRKVEEYAARVAAGWRPAGE